MKINNFHLGLVLIVLTTTIPTGWANEQLMLLSTTTVIILLMIGLAFLTGLYRFEYTFKSINHSDTPPADKYCLLKPDDYEVAIITTSPLVLPAIRRYRKSKRLLEMILSSDNLSEILDYVEERRIQEITYLTHIEDLMLYEKR